MVAVPDWVIESVEPEKDRGTETVVACTTPVLLVESTLAGKSDMVRFEVDAVPK